jgi:hypothetical protein
MEPEYIFGPLLAVFLIVQLVRRIRGRPNDYPDDGTSYSSGDSDDDMSDDA